MTIMLSSLSRHALRLPASKVRTTLSTTFSKQSAFSSNAAGASSSPKHPLFLMGNVPVFLAAATVAFGWAVSRYSTRPTANEEQLNSPRILFVWDFDWTIINCNSDEYIPAQFMTEEQLYQGLKKLWEETNGNWHACVEGMVHQTGASQAEILKAAQQMPYLTGVKSAMDQIQSAAPQTSQMILSDGNTIFIGAFLEHHGMINYFPHGIVTNLGNWTPEGRLQVTHQSQQYGGHDCKRCPANLCKTQALNHTLNNSKNRPSRIVYIGDGGNDACPALMVLKEGDVLLARVGNRRKWANQRKGPESDEQANAPSNSSGVLVEGASFGISKALQKAKGEDPPLVPKCQVREWTTGEDLKRLVAEILKES